MTKKNLIFSIFEDIRIDKKFEAKQNNTLTQFRKYYDKLIANHKQYAEYCNADYKMIHLNCKDMDSIHIPVNDVIQSDYDTINFEKLFLLEHFANTTDYENILYIDLDVISGTKKNFFEKWDMNTIVSRYEASGRYDKLGMQVLLDTIVKDDEERRKHVQHLKQTGQWEDHARKYIDDNYDEAFKKLDKYHWLVKGECIHRMLKDGEDGTIKRDNVINTAITGGGREVIKSMKLTERFPQYVQEFKDLKEKEEKFELNNEIFITWLINKFNVPYTNLPEWWHNLCLVSDDKVHNACLWHVIDKDFERVFKLQNFA